jgi:hypothetical protein
MGGGHAVGEAEGQGAVAGGDGGDRPEDRARHPLLGEAGAVEAEVERPAGTVRAGGAGQEAADHRFAERAAEDDDDLVGPVTVGVASGRVHDVDSERCEPSGVRLGWDHRLDRPRE